MLTDAQLKERLGYIGGSDAPGVLGLSRWASPVSVWAEKTGKVPPADLSNNLAVKLGSRLEEVVAELFTEETGKKLRRVNRTIFHPKYPFIAANIDRDVVGEDAIWEGKTASGYKAKEWEGEDIPHEYIIQAMHYLAVTGAKRAYVACLIGNQEFVWKPVDRDEAALKNLIKSEVEFWEEFVLPGVMPDKFTAHDKETLEKLYPQGEEDKTIILDDESDNDAELLQGMFADEKDLKGRIETMKNKMRARLGTAEIGLTQRFKIYWANMNVRRVDMDAFKAAQPELYESFRQPKLERRFLVKALKEAVSGKP